MPRRLVLRVARLALIVVVTIVLVVLLRQHSLIYFPRSYSEDQLRQLPTTTLQVEYNTAEGEQRAFYIPAQSGKPRRIWAMFNGNGSVALDWLDFTASADPRDAFLLIDYPGYGASTGRASPQTIAESSEAAATWLCKRLDAAPEQFQWAVFGHSIGCAAGLQFATKWPVERIILVAPFTTLRDMARRVVGWPLSLLLMHNFDNTGRLAELASRKIPPKVMIFHGTSDDIIPISMGRRLAEAHPQMITFHAIENAGHNDIISLAAEELRNAVNE